MRRNLGKGQEVLAAQHAARRDALMGLKGSLAQVGGCGGGKVARRSLGQADEGVRRDSSIILQSLCMH